MLKRLSYLLFFVVISYINVLVVLQGSVMYLNSKIGNMYFDGIGDEASFGKTAHLELEERSILRSDNLIVYGSCELESRYDKFNDNMSITFSNKNNGFQVNKIGVAGTRSFFHAMDVGSLDKDIAEKKIVFIASESWFKEGGGSELEEYFSKTKYYSFMFNPKLSTSLKKRLAKRVIAMRKNKKSDFSLEIMYAKIYNSGSILPKIVRPFYNLYYKLLVAQDKRFASQKLDECKARKMPEIVTPVIRKHDWATEKLSAIEKEEAISNNDFCVRDERLADFPSRLEEYRFKFPSDSPEHEDFLIFLEACKELKVRPLIIYWPVHGKVLDHYVKKFRLKNSRKQIEELQGWVRDTVKSYGFELTDFSEYEYVCYFNSGYTQPGSLGLTYVNEAISEFFHKN